jgi:MFS family permease
MSTTLDAATVADAGAAEHLVAAVQRRTLRLLFVTQVISGIGVAIGASVGALLAADMAGIGVSGLAQSAVVIGAALFAVPATAIVRRSGRRASLTLLYGTASAGAVVVVLAAMAGSVPLLFGGFFLFGGASAAGYQARYAAVDLAPPLLRGRHLSIVIWATTIGAVAGPNLAPVAGTTLAPLGVPVLAAPFFFSALLLALAATVLMLTLRPDPMRVALSLHADAASTTGPRDAHAQEGLRAALRVVMASPPARLGVSAMAAGHVAMIAVMAMAPVHIRGAGHDAAHTLRIVGIVLSLHIAGMFAFSPVMGWLTDRFGRRTVIRGGVVLLLAACALAGTAGHDSAQLAIALLVLGLGWSANMVAGSTLLTDAMPTRLRASGQGLSDLTMGLAGASAAALSGLIVATWSYAMLALLAALTTLPLIAQAFRPEPAGLAHTGP